MRRAYSSSTRRMVPDMRVAIAGYCRSRRVRVACEIKLSTTEDTEDTEETLFSASSVSSVVERSSRNVLSKGEAQAELHFTRTLGAEDASKILAAEDAV